MRQFGGWNAYESRHHLCMVWVCVRRIWVWMVKVLMYVSYIADNRRIAMVSGLTWNGSKRQEISPSLLVKIVRRTYISSFNFWIYIEYWLGTLVFGFFSTQEANDVIARARVPQPQRYLGCVYRYKVVVYWACCEEHCDACNEIVSTHGSICRG